MGLAALLIAIKPLYEKVQWSFENSSLKDGKSDSRKTQIQETAPCIPGIPQNVQQPYLFF